MTAIEKLKNNNSIFADPPSIGGSLSAPSNKGLCAAIKTVQEAVLEVHSELEETNAQIRELKQGMIVGPE